MTTGRTVLTQMEGAIAGIRGDESKLDAALQSAEAEATRLREQRVLAFKALAEVKLDLLARDQFVGELDAAERRARDLLHRHEASLQDLAAKRNGATRALEEAERHRHGKAAVLEKAVEALDLLTTDVKGVAQAGSDWKTQQQVAATAAKVAEESDKKAKLAESDLAGKKKPYEADPLFMYLWKRKFGASEYASGYFVRYFDRKVAALIDYSSARANFHMLNEIPTRLRGHADNGLAAAKAEAGKLSGIEAAALERAGGAPLAAAVSEARAVLEAAERELAGKRAVLGALEKLRETALKEGSDGAYQQAVALLAQSDSKLDLRSLRDDAMATTSTPNDEAIVVRIQEIETAISRADQEIAAIRKEARDYALRRVEIERVRDVSRQRGYDNPFGTFQNGPVIGQVIGSILKGVLQGAVLDQVLRDGYRERANTWQPDFGNRGGGLNFPNFGTGGSTRHQNDGGLFPTNSDSGSSWTGGWSDWIGGSSGGSSGGSGSSSSDSGSSGDFSSSDSF